MSAGNMAKLAAEQFRIKKENEELRAQLAVHEKRAAVETELLSVLRDPRASLDMKPADIEDFLTKRAELEGLADLQTMRVAVKMASTRSYVVGDREVGTPSPVTSSGSKADDEFRSYFLGSDAAG